MNLNNIKLHGIDKFEPHRPVYVLLHISKTHVYCLPNGEADWAYSKADMHLREQILQKDFSIRDYFTVPLSTALVEIANVQAELETAWRPVIADIRRTKSLSDRFNLYKRALARYKAHPLSADALLKRLLRL
jgi:hypothetical protein